MTDFSIKNSSVNLGVNSSLSKDSEFEKLKKEYEAFVQKTGKSDLANAPVLIRNRLEFLSKLKETALNLGLKDELEWIEEEKSMLSSATDSDSSPKTAPYYPIASTLPAGKKKSNVNVAKIIEKCKQLDKGKIDTNALRIINAFEEPDDYFVPDIIRQCRNNGDLPFENVAAIESLASAGVSAIVISHEIKSIQTEDDKGNVIIDPDLCKQIVKAKSLGFDDRFSFKVAKVLNQNYADNEILLSSINELIKADISQEAVLDIINALTVVDKTTGQKYINKDSVNTIISLKKTLVKTRGNEKKEKLCPVSQYKAPKEFYRNDDKVCYIKNDDSILIQDLDSLMTAEEARQLYKNSIADTEDYILVEFANKYKSQDGSINSNYIRVLSNLRAKGITYNDLLPFFEFSNEQKLNSMYELILQNLRKDIANINPALLALTDKCINENNGIDSQTLNLAALIHSAGALSEDIPALIDSIGRNSDGKYNEEDIKHVCDLTKAVIAEPQLSQLLPHVKTSESVKDFIIRSAYVFKDRQNIADLINMTKSDGENIDDVALEIVNDLLFSENNDKSERQFMSFIPHILEIARGSEDTASDAAERICCAVDFFSPDEVQSLLEICTDAKGNIDEKLSQAVYKLYHDGCGYDVIMSKIEACKNGSDIDYDKLSKIV